MRKSCKVFTPFMVAAILLCLNASVSWAQKTGPIKMGFVAPLSGTFSQVGKDMVDGIRMYLEEIGYQVAGRKIELIVEDNEGVPAAALTKTRKLVEKDGVQVMAGLFLAAEGYAIGPYIDSKQIPMNLPVTAGDDLTQRTRYKWMVRTGWDGSQAMHPFGEYAYTVLKLRKIAAICPDFAFGWESLDGFQRTFEELGGKVVQKIWFPLTVQDFSPYLSMIRRDVDAVFTNQAGRMSLQFLKAYEEFGLKGKLPLIGTGTTTDESVLPSLGDEAVDFVSALHYSAALDNPANRTFVKAFRDKNGKPPGYYAETCYTGGKFVVEAIRAIQGDVENRNRLLEALRKVEVKNAPRGPSRGSTHMATPARISIYGKCRESEGSYRTR